MVPGTIERSEGKSKYLRREVVKGEDAVGVLRK